LRSLCLATTLDSTGDVWEYTSVTVGTDGFGLISYQDGTNGDCEGRALRAHRLPRVRPQSLARLLFSGLIGLIEAARGIWRERKPRLRRRKDNNSTLNLATRVESLTTQTTETPV
jgi:hypothetical protein